MAGVIKDFKSEYSKKYIKENNYDKVKNIALNDLYAPMFLPELNFVYGEAEPSIKDLNEAVDDITNDLTLINLELVYSTYKIASLANSINKRIESVQNKVAAEKERLDDLNILCKKYNMDGVKNINEFNVTGNFNVDGNIYTSEIVNYNIVPIEIISINGNGYEGNNYVLTDKNEFLKNKLDSSNKNNLVDNNLVTFFEYSRITADENEKNIFPLLNKDNNEAKFTIVLYSKKTFNYIKINCDTKDTILSDVAISKDGIEFNTVITKEVLINDPNIKYSTDNYIANSGLICFPNTNYLKLTLQSNSTTNEKIGFYKINIKEG